MGLREKARQTTSERQMTSGDKVRDKSMSVRETSNDCVRDNECVRDIEVNKTARVRDRRAIA